jgi:tetratricopeptide (TPR) repeat protein
MSEKASRKFEVILMTLALVLCLARVYCFRGDCPELKSAGQMVEQKRFSEALPLLENCLKRDGASVTAYVLRANANLGLGNFEQAVADCDHAININPHEPKAFTNRAWALLSLERYQEAIDDCTHALGLDANHGNAYSCRAEAYRRLGRSELAMQDSSRARDLGVTQED